MKTLLMVTALSLAILAPPLHAQSAAAKPGPEHRKLEVWTGKWSYEESCPGTPFTPAGKGTYGSAARMILNGLAVEERGQGTSSAGAYSWILITSYDAEKGRYQNSLFDTEGAFPQPWKGDSGSLMVQGNTWTHHWKFVAEGHPYFGRSVCVFAPDGKSYTYDWAYSEDGTNWKPWYTGSARKVGKAPKK